MLELLVFCLCKCLEREREREREREMGRGGKGNLKRNFKRRVRSNDEDSNGSDEDYVIEDDENVSDAELEDLGDSLNEFESEESFGSFVEEEIEEEEEKGEFGKVAKSKKNKGSLQNGKTGGKSLQKRKRTSYEDDEDYVNDDDDDDDDDDVVYDEDDYGDDDEEFTPDEDDDCLDEEEELDVKKKTNSLKVGKRTAKKKHSRRGQKKRGRPRVSKNPLVKKGRQIRRLKKKERCEYDDEGDADFIDNCPVLGEKGKKNGKRRRKYTVDSDSDFMPSGSSDYNYTISEEEREQVREANALYGDLKTSLRSSTSVKGIQQNGDLYQQRQAPGRKGKEKVKEIKPEVGRQVCGICLSEENKRRFRGTLNCCSHYFCFACIMEWSKVESRCPCCKQRFKTITKNGRSTAGVDLRNLVIQVPKRDQVYQPSEEEIRNFIDPYENVICTECHEGGDDGLMLLCDLCDSPAHTYCVGLGRQVPEGNWYCNGCRPVALGSSNSQAYVPLIGQSTPGREAFNRPSPLVNIGEGLDPIIESSPRVFTQGLGNLSSPRLYNGDLEAASPLSGAGAPTLSGRRQLHRRIQDMLSNNRMNLMTSRSHGILTANLHGNLSNSQSCRGRETTVQNTRTQEMGASQPVLLEERLWVNDHPSSSVQDRGPLFGRTNPSRRQEVQDPAVERTVSLTLWPELTGMNLVPSYEQAHQCNNRSSVGFDVNLSPYRIREESQFYTAKEQLGPVVKSHLKRLSRDIELGPDTFMDIARSSTHTILAACGLEHKQSEVHTVPPPLVCIHVDSVAAGETSLMKGFCSSCFDSFVGDVVKRIMDTKLPRWLSLAL